MMSDIDRSTIQVTSENYIDCVKATEPKTYEPAYERLQEVRHHLAIAMILSMQAGCLMDAVKKYLFYSREYPNAAKQLLSRYGKLLNETPDYGVARLLNLVPFSVEVLRLLHCNLGLVSETGEELTGVVFRHLFTGEPIDWTNINEELGDTGWYWGVGVDTSQHTMDQCLTTNIRKLAARYPESFEELLANNRNLEEERKVLEATDDYRAEMMEE